MNQPFDTSASTQSSSTRSSNVDDWPWVEESVPAVMNMLFDITADLARALPLVERCQPRDSIQHALVGLDEVIASFVAQRRPEHPETVNHNTQGAQQP